MRIVCGLPWTIDGRWVVVSDGHIAYDPGNNDAWLDLLDCFHFRRGA